MSKNTSQLDWCEVRRRRVWELKQLGWTKSASAALGVAPGAVSQ